MARSVPLLLSLFLTFAFAVASLGVLINAFVKSNDEASYAQKVAPAGTVVQIEDNDILTTGKVSTAVQAVLILLSLLSLSALSITRFASPRVFLLLGALLAFSTIWLLATTIAFTVIFATKSAKISATAGGIAIPQSIIAVIEAEFGLTPVYKKLGYLRTATIIPWFTFLFAAISSVLMLSKWRASNRVGNHDVHENRESAKDSM